MHALCVDIIPLLFEAKQEPFLRIALEIVIWHTVFWFGFVS